MQYYMLVRLIYLSVVLLKTYHIVFKMFKIRYNLSFLIGLVYFYIYACFLDFDYLKEHIIFSGVQSFVELCVQTELLSCKEKPT